MIRRLKFCALFSASACALLGIAATSRAALFSYEGFDYANSGSALLTGKAGGSGWGGPWQFSGAALTNNAGLNTSQDDASLTSAAFPFAPVGDRVVAAGPGSGPNNVQADRLLGAPFDLGVEGNLLYLSFMYQKTTGPATGSDNMEVTFLSGLTGGTATVPIRVGSTSAERFFVFDGGSVPAGATFETLTLGTNYFIVLRLEAHPGTTPNVYSVVTYAPTDTVPVAEPTTWEGAYSGSASNATLDGIRLWIGAVTTGQFDEIRIGNTWASVTAVPEPSAVLLAVAAGLGLTRTRRRES
jgi:hypothetical protein